MFKSDEEATISHARVYPKGTRVCRHYICLKQTCHDPGTFHVEVGPEPLCHEQACRASPDVVVMGYDVTQTYHKS